MKKQVAADIKASADEIKKDLRKALDEQKKEVTKSINKTIQGVKDDLVKEMVVIKQEIAGVRALAAKAHTSPIESETIFLTVGNRSVIVSCLMVPQYPTRKSPRPLGNGLMM